jgi:hypothetical protein
MRSGYKRGQLVRVHFHFSCFYSCFSLYSGFLLKQGKFKIEGQNGGPFQGTCRQCVSLVKLTMKQERIDQTSITANPVL